MYLGQANQDCFVLNILKHKKNGVFLELGSHHPILNNNTYLLESKYGWNGIMVEYTPTYLPLYKEHRSNSIHMIGDARKIDYRDMFEKNNMPLCLDYLQVDLEVDNGSTIDTLKKLDKEIFDKYKFATITFEHDIYNTNYGNTRIVSRDIFKKRGYLCVFEDVNNSNNPYEDWYVHPDLVDMDYVNRLIYHNREHYVQHNISGKTIDFKNIKYIE
jgi:hypothetical protein